MPNDAGLNVLAVDDDAATLRSVVDVLHGECRVHPFISGQEALAYLQDNQADLILLDHRMPGLSGFDVLRELQAVCADIPIIFLTSTMDDEVEVRALEMGAADYIRKPFKPEILRMRVRLHLELQGHRKHLETLVTEKNIHLLDAWQKLKIREEITVTLLARTADMRDHYTGIHVARTADFVRALVDGIQIYPWSGYNLSPSEAGDIVHSSLLHDVGKIAVPDKILLNPGRLTAEEKAIVRQHPVWGEQLLRGAAKEQDNAFLNIARDIAIAHHEHWDGGGYPHGLRDTDIPLPARIVAVADVYEALTAARPYKTPYSHEQAMDTIQASSGRQFDPQLANVFMHQANIIEQIHRRTIPASIW